jgi:hypothetical protein
MPVRSSVRDQGAWARLAAQARCADADIDADRWFPVNPKPARARREAADAIAVCDDCPVRAQCLAWSLEHWTVGQHGVWGGLVPAERAVLRRSLLLAS